jgi:hypothetical protein
MPVRNRVRRQLSRAGRQEQLSRGHAVAGCIHYYRVSFSMRAGVSADDTGLVPSIIRTAIRSASFPGQVERRLRRAVWADLVTGIDC